MLTVLFFRVMSMILTNMKQDALKVNNNSKDGNKQDSKNINPKSLTDNLNEVKESELNHSYDDLSHCDGQETCNENENSSYIFIGDIDKTCTEQDIKKLFNGVGNIQKIKIKKSNFTGEPQGNNSLIKFINLNLNFNFSEQLNFNCYIYYL